MLGTVVHSVYDTLIWALPIILIALVVVWVRKLRAPV